jgi:hypothetical protein
MKRSFGSVRSQTEFGNEGQIRKSFDNKDEQIQEFGSVILACFQFQ